MVFPFSVPTRARRGLAALLGLCLLAAGLTGCRDESDWHNTDVSGSLPDLAFTMTRAEDGKTVTADDYRGKVALLYFGYTFCPDICPLTLANVAKVLDEMGEAAKQVRVLFVTVDPDRDTLTVLKDYTAAFGPQVDGLRGSPDQLAALARRYRVAYSVKPGKEAGSFEVTHSPAVYVFDQKGKARLLATSLDTAAPEIVGTAADLKRLAEGSGGGGPFAWLRRLF
ncbi:protein SCO1/2 [Tistlia consotensis]|uniref:Protein SCO1/2 n=1 Tax=Tistlia consotensis USBA 355 TaxID=560819 RepID=A0A1Y6BRD4_9PROT|nr:SCO family protein [Tistlia consotensis]SMF15969.1 protein SCO1/2 [Tistlia consotensis USBA 355]SNR41537.1 protein SCO1/2 [Tistlia consotensis]